MRTYARYSGMATEMLVLLIIMVFIGKKVDAYFEFDKRYGTALLVVLALFAYLYRLYIQINKMNKK